MSIGMELERSLTQLVRELTKLAKAARYKIEGNRQGDV